MFPESVSRAELLRRLAALVSGRAANGSLRVAIDGPDAAGKTTLADDLADTLRRSGASVLRASIDGFHHPASLRHRRSESNPTLSYFEDSFDYPAVRRLLLDPLGPSGNHRIRTRVFDHRSDQPIHESPHTAPEDSVLLFDGVFLLRPELAECWDLSIYLSVDPAVTLERALTRDLSLFGTRAKTEQRYRARYLPGQAHYLSSVDPEQHTDVFIGNNDPASPTILRFPSM